MRKICIGLGVITLLIIASGSFYVRQLTIPYIQFANDIQVTPEYNTIYYPVYSANPFHEDLMWVSTYEKEYWYNRKQYLFDMKSEQVIATAGSNTDVTSSRKHGMTIGSQNTDWRSILRIQVERWLKLNPQSQTDSVYHLFTMQNDRKEMKYFLYNNTQVYLDRGSFSPDGNYFLCTSYSAYGVSKHIIDLQLNTITSITDSYNYQSGWWSNSELLQRSQTNDTLLRNTVTNEKNILFSPVQLSQYIADHKLLITDPNQYELITVWDGTEYQFLIASHNRMPRHPNYAAPNPDEKWLFKINKDTKELETVSRDFPFPNYGKWNENITKYVYNEKSDGGYWELKFYDIQSGISKPLLPADTPMTEWALPGFYHDQIVFASHKSLWIVNQDGSGLRQLFPPVN